MNKSNKHVYAVIIGGLAILLLYFFVTTPKLSNVSTSPSNEVAMMEAQNLNLVDEKNNSPTESNMDVKTLVMGAEDTKVINLKDVTGGSSTGTAYILRRDGSLYHTVLANLPDLAGNEFYEGWLVKNPDTSEFFSTGAMTKEKNNMYELSFSSTQNYEGYDTVVITLEKIDDKTPEVHILESM
jgi:hypothetical protein